MDTISETIDIPSLKKGQTRVEPGDDAEDWDRLVHALEHRLYGRVNPHLLKDQLQQVNVSRQDLKEALQKAIQDLKLCMQRPMIKAAGEVEMEVVAIFDAKSEALWLAAPPKCLDLKDTGKASCFCKPRDKTGKLIHKLEDMEVWTSEDLQNATCAYKLACYNAEKAIEVQLQNLSLTLKPHQQDLRAAIVFTVYAATFESHARLSLRKGWNPSQQLLPGEADSRTLSLKGFWPYWMSSAAPGVVKQDLDLQGGGYILTGPNNGGKSTLLRDVTAIAVLSACGLDIPAEAAKLPYFDAFIMRFFSTDNPLDGHGGLDEELVEVSHVLENATPESLVMVDELGKGTTPMDGETLAANFLGYLQCTCTLATHLHGLLDRRKEYCIESVKEICMGSDNDLQEPELRGLLKKHKATFKVGPGQNRVSHAEQIMHEQCQDIDLLRKLVSLRKIAEESRKPLEIE